MLRATTQIGSRVDCGSTLSSYITTSTSCLLDEEMRFFAIAVLASRCTAAPLDFTVDDQQPRAPGHVEEGANNYWEFPLHVEVHYSDAHTRVGALDLFAATWQAFYTAADETGVDLQRDEKAYTPGCYTDGVDDGAKIGRLETRTSMVGSWGTIDPLTGWQVRDALIQALWSALQILRVPDDDYDTGDGSVMTGCTGTLWMEPTPMGTDAACGVNVAHRCGCPDKDAVPTAQCALVQPSYAVPSQLTVHVYDARSRPLNADLRADFSSQDLVRHRGCGKLGAVGEIAASYLPEVGKLIESAIKITCRPSASL